MRKRATRSTLIDTLTGSIVSGTVVTIKRSGLSIPANRPFRIATTILETAADVAVNIEMAILNQYGSIIATSGPHVCFTTTRKIVINNPNRVFYPTGLDGGTQLIKIMAICDYKNQKAVCVYNLRTHIQLGQEDISTSCPAMNSPSVEVSPLGASHSTELSLESIPEFVNGEECDYDK